MIEGFLNDIAVEIVIILATLTSTLIVAVYTNRQDIKKIKQRLFGLERDDVDKGHIKESNERLANLSDRVENLDKDISEVQNTLESIEQKVDTRDEGYNITDDD